MSELPDAAGGRRGAVRGIQFMCLAMLLIPVMNSIAKSLTVDYPLVQVVWARFAGHFVCMTLLFWPTRGWRLFVSARPALQFARSAIMFASNGCFIVALSTVALATASAIMFTAPLMVTALSAAILGERVGARRWSAVLLGFAGALIIIRPGLGAIGLDASGFDASGLGVVLLLISAGAFALYQILTRMLSDRDPPETMIVYAALIAALVMSAVMPFHFVVPMVAVDWLLMAALGVIGGFAQYFVVKALDSAPASVVAPYAYGELLVAALLGYAVFGDFPDAWTWLGAAVIVASGVYIAYREGLRDRTGGSRG